MNDYILQIILAIIALLGSVLTATWLPYLQTKLAKNKLTELKFWVKLAVGAAEQTFTKEEQGTMKKKFVVDFLKGKGIDISEDELDIIIEACVRELNLAADKIDDYGI